ncbi:MAG: M14 family metallopeptidase [Nitrospinota bacterium]|nr:M14 family metallopeptidase [Nitrospinota bacterium]
MESIKTMDLNIIDEIPNRLLEVSPSELHQVLPGPTLLRIPGEKEPPFFISTLLHGNEPTGFLAVQQLLNHYRRQDKPLPRSVWLFLGNVAAARENARHLPDQPDYNRIWKGGTFPEHRLVTQLLEILESTTMFAGVDIHNTSGKNPHYACVNKLDGPFINLGKLFSPTIVYFTRPDEVISRALAEFCTAITIESGQARDPFGVDHVLDFLEQCLALDSIPKNANNPGAPKVYHSIARIEVPDDCRIGFGESCQETDFNFVENLESMNFVEQAENTLVGWRCNPNLKLAVVDEHGKDVSEGFISYTNGEIRLIRSIVPSMLTTYAPNVLDDCLGYLMQRYALK